MRNITKFALMSLALWLALGSGMALADPANFLGNTSFRAKYANYEALPLPVEVLGAGGNCTLAAGPGHCTASGIVNVTNFFSPANAAVPVWNTVTTDGTQLTGFFTGLSMTSFVPVGGGGFDVTFTGGTLTLYNLAGATNFDATNGAAAGPTAATALTAATAAPFICSTGPGTGACPAPWLTLAFVPGVDDTGPNITTVDSHLDSSTGPASGDSLGYMSVTGGLHAAIFDTDGFTFTNHPPADMRILSDLTVCPDPTCAGSWPISSEDPVIGSVVPEPASLLLLGSGLTGLGLWRWTRRRQTV